GNGGQATPSITHLQVAQRLGRQRYCCADDRRILRDVFPRSAVHAARARLRSGRGRPRLPARRTPNRDARAGFLRAAEHAFRPRDGVGPRPIARCGLAGGGIAAEAARTAGRGCSRTRDLATYDTRSLYEALPMSNVTAEPWVSLPIQLRSPRRLRRLL